MVEQSVGWVLAAALPHSADARMVDWIAALWRRTKTAEARKVVGRIRAALPGRFDEQRATALMSEWYRRRAELTWGRLRELHRSGWKVGLEIEGLEHLTTVREHGKGAVVWYMSFCESFLMMRAMADAGVPVGHLSLYSHGVPGRSRFGFATAGRMYRAAENRYLQARVVMRNRTSPGYFKQLGALLKTNHAVTVRGDLAASGSSVGALCLGVECEFASGAARLAFQSGAPLLTAYAQRVAPFHYRVVIEEAITVDRTQKKVFVSDAVAEFGRRLDAQLAGNAPDWEGWWSVDRLVSSAETVGIR